MLDLNLNQCSCAYLIIYFVPIFKIYKQKYITGKLDVDIVIKNFQKQYPHNMYQVYIKSCYCVIVYVSHFWPPNFSPIYVRSLLYMSNSLLFMSIFSLFLPLRRKHTQVDGLIRHILYLIFYTPYCNAKVPLVQHFII